MRWDAKIKIKAASTKSLPIQLNYGTCKQEAFRSVCTFRYISSLRCSYVVGNFAIDVFVLNIEKKINKPDNCCTRILYVVTDLFYVVITWF